METKKKGVVVLLVVTLLISSTNIAFATDDDFPIVPFAEIENTQQLS
jgi:hypothetical protein